MSALSTSSLSVELLLRVIDVKYGYFTLLFLLYSYSTVPFSSYSVKNNDNELYLRVKTC